MSSNDSGTILKSHEGITQLQHPKMFMLVRVEYRTIIVRTLFRNKNINKKNKKM